MKPYEFNMIESETFYRMIDDSEDVPGAVKMAQKKLLEYLNTSVTFRDEYGIRHIDTKKLQSLLKDFGLEK